MKVIMEKVQMETRFCTSAEGGRIGTHIKRCWLQTPGHQRTAPERQGQGCQWDGQLQWFGPNSLMCKRAEKGERLCFASCTAKEIWAGWGTWRKRAGKGGPLCGVLAQHFCSHPSSVTDSCTPRMEVVQRDTHTQWDSRAVHGMTPSAGEESGAATNLVEQRCQRLCFPPERWERGGGKAAMPSLMMDEDV